MQELVQELATIPPQLRRCKPPVKHLFYRGDPALLDLPKVAVVGSRKCLTYTQNAVKNLCATLRRYGICVVSGGAIGADNFAHEAALPLTIGVFANSLERFYPVQNTRTITQIYERGLALSEHERGHAPRGSDFLARNRIVVGLADALVIAQADLQSGSMQSARLAGEMGVPLFVLPQRLGESDGTNALLADGRARLVADFEKFCDEFRRDFCEKRGLDEADFGRISAGFGGGGGGGSLFDDDALLACVARGAQLDELLEKFGEDAVFGYELEGRIVIDGVNVRLA